MEFLKLLYPTKDSETIAKVMSFNENTTFRMFNSIIVKESLWLSLQASYGHYCSPRKTLRDVAEYTSMEFALMDADRNFKSVTEVLPNFSRLKEIEEYESTVYGYVPVDLIQDLINELYKKYKKHKGQQLTNWFCYI